MKWSWNKHSKTRQQGSGKLTFHTPGTYRYLCTIHDFTGKIVVK